ncbi:MAG: energy-coupling factor transporter transmembrane component T [Thermoprotei archaeon]
MRKPHVSIVFIYALVVTILAFVYRSGYPLLVLTIVNLLLGFPIGALRHKFITAMLLLAIWGVFLNALIVANTGEVVAVLGPLVIRSGVVEAVSRIGARLTAIAGAALFFISLYNPYEIIRGLESELGLPKIISFPLAYGLRLLPLVSRDFKEIRLCRRERSYRVVPVTPGDIASYLQPLLSISLERALWTGIAIELRGFYHRKTRYKGFKPNTADYLVLAILLVQLLIPFL